MASDSFSSSCKFVPLESLVREGFLNRPTRSQPREDGVPWLCGDAATPVRMRARPLRVISSCWAYAKSDSPWVMLRVPSLHGERGWMTDTYRESSACCRTSEGGDRI